MKNSFKTFALGALGLIACSCASNQVEVTPGTPVFSNFTYTGQERKGTTTIWSALRLPSIRVCLSSILRIW